MPKTKISTPKGDITIHTPDKNGPEKDLYLPDEKIEKILDEIEKDETPSEYSSNEIAEFKAAMQKALEAADTRDKEQVIDDVVNEIKKSEGFSEILKTTNNSGESIAATYGRLLGEVIASERTGIEPDWDSLFPKAAPMIEEAVNAYLAKEKDVKIDNLGKVLQTVGLLFYPGHSAKLAANQKLRMLARRGNCSFADDNFNSSYFFDDLRLFHTGFDQEALLKKIRRVDAELRNISSTEKEEFSHNLAECILSLQNETYRVRGWFNLNDQDFHMLGEESRKTLRDLVLMYTLAVEHHNVYRNGYEYVRTFDTNKVNSLIDFAKKPAKYPFEETPNFGTVRYVKKDEYLNILTFGKALYEALPNGFQDTITAAMWVNGDSVKVDISSSTVTPHIAKASQAMRNAFISLVQGRGSLESFFEHVIQYYGVLGAELNDRVKVLANLVGLYDSLGINIAEALEASCARLAFDPPF